MWKVLSGKCGLKILKYQQINNKIKKIKSKKRSKLEIVFLTHSYTYSRAVYIYNIFNVNTHKWKWKKKNINIDTKHQGYIKSCPADFLYKYIYMSCCLS